MHHIKNSSFSNDSRWRISLNGKKCLLKCKIQQLPKTLMHAIHLYFFTVKFIFCHIHVKSHFVNIIHLKWQMCGRVVLVLNIFSHLHIMETHLQYLWARVASEEEHKLCFLQMTCGQTLLNTPLLRIKH